MYSRDSTIMRKLLGRGTSSVALDSAAQPTMTAVPATATATATATAAAARTSSAGSDASGSGSGGSSDSPWEFARGQLAAPRTTKHSQDATYVAAAPILNIDASPDGRFLALSGRHILRTVRAERTQFTDDVDLRTMITSIKGGKGSAISDQLSIQDVKWYDNQSVFTACASGKIYYYDLTQARTKAVFAPQPFQDNTRQVTALDVSPHRRSWVLSGSQDGVVRIWDARTPTAPSRGRPQFQLQLSRRVHAHSESIRSIRWAPRDGFYFAFATESGMIFKADIRSTTAAPQMRINAHEGACSSISWHPDGIHLLSGGMDNKLHVWDLNSTDKRQKPKWAIQTPAPVGQALWRPSLWSATDQGRRAAQIAVTYDASSQRRHGRSMVHIWDLGRPTLPYKIIERFDTAPTGLLWRDQDVLWAVGQDGNLQQCDVAFAPRVVDRQSVSAFAFNPNGDAMIFLDKRLPLAKPRMMPILTRFPGPGYKSGGHKSGGAKSGTQTPVGQHSMGSSPQTPVLSIGRTDSDEDLTGTFLNPRAPTVGRTRRGSLRGGGQSGLGNNSTSENGQPHEPVIAPHQDKQAMPLEESMQASGEFQLTQGMGFATTPARSDPEMYRYLTFHYLTILQNGLLSKGGSNGKSLVERVSAILSEYATIAERARLFRLAQSWLILRHVAQILLDHRAEYHYQVRMGQLRRVISKANVAAAVTPARTGRPSEPSTERKVSNSLYPQAPARDQSRTSARSLLAEEIENTSNITTPRALAIPDSKVNEHIGSSGTPLSPVLEASSNTFSLSSGLAQRPANYPAISSSPRGSRPEQPCHAHTLSTASHQSSGTHASTEGYDFYGAAEAFSDAIDVPGTVGTLGRTTASSGSYGRSHGQMSTSVNSRNTDRSLELSRDGDDLDGDGEYHSRVRGKRVSASPEQVRRNGVWDISRATSGDSTQDVFTVSSTTIHTRTSHSQSHDFPASLPSEAGTVEMMLSTRQPIHRPPHISLLHSAPEPTALEKAMASDSSTISDYDCLPWRDDPPFPFPIIHTAGSDNLGYRDPTADPPMNPLTFIRETLEFECRKSAVNAAAIILLLGPLVPEDVISSFQAEAILRQHHSRLMSMRHFIEAAQLRNLCTENWVPGLPGWAANYPAIFGQAQKDSSVHFLCPFCEKPREIDRTLGPAAIWTCDRCSRTLDPCAVCKHRHVVADLLNEVSRDDRDPNHVVDPTEPVLATWWYCHGCGHGGHANCLQAWHYPVSSNPTPEELSGGFCPQAGCDHACLPRTAVNDPVIPKDPPITRKFPYVERSVRVPAIEAGDVPVSRAAEAAREVLGRGNLGGQGRRTRVKFEAGKQQQLQQLLQQGQQPQHRR